MPLLAEGRTRASFAEASEADEFVATVERYERGELTPDEWRAYRLVRGTYGQRQAGDAQMIRVKVPQGVLDGPQLHALADVAERWSRGFGHVTTRQNVQFHFLKLHDVGPVLARLAEAGLTTREACGNAVRNVTACPWAGVAADEAFDVTPYAEALTRHLLRHPLSSTLPRKFKIAFEGCAADHSLTAINDLGFRAAVLEGRRVFRVTAGGGTSILPRSGEVLHEALPAGEILRVAEAVVRVYHRLGDYEHKRRNRLKFLVRDLGGFEAFRGHYAHELAAVQAPLPFPAGDSPREDAPPGARPRPPTLGEVAARAAAGRVKGPGLVPEPRRFLPVLDGAFLRWRGTNVRPQRQAPYATVTVTLPLGDVTAAQLRLLADFAQAYGDGTVRTTHDQDLLLRWVRAGDVPELYRRLAVAALATDGARTLADVTSCPGAEACRLAVTQSRGLGRALEQRLRARPDLVDAAGSLDLKISGCPNGCGQHHVAGLGFQGSVRRLGDRVVPQYFVMVGGGVNGHAQFGRLVAKIPARRVPDAVERLVALYRQERAPGQTALEWLRSADDARLKAALADLERLTPEDALPADFVDLGEEGEYRVETLAGECSA
jgi:sulfite reductase (NADPH) hemoprotein beta-component